MGIHKSYKYHFQLKECNKIRLVKQQWNNSIKEITKHLAEMNETQFNLFQIYHYNHDNDNIFGGWTF